MVTFDHVSKIYKPDIKALDDLSLHVDEGEFVFIVGSSGAGKSTLLKLIMVEETPTSGKVIVGGVDTSQLTRKRIPYYRRGIGVVFQDFRLIPSMTVYDNVAFALRVTNVSVREIKRRVPWVLDMVGLVSKARRYPDSLSGGEQQRVALARALVNNPTLLIADEPTGNVDPEMSYTIVGLLSDINRCGTTVMMVTHEHNLVSKFDHRIIAIDSGTVVADGRIARRARQ